MNKISPLVKVLLFVSSYFPLTLIFLVIDFKSVNMTNWKVFLLRLFNHAYISWSLLIITLISCVVLVRLLRYYSKKCNDTKSIDNMQITAMDKEVLSYIFSYVLPFLSFPPERRIIIIGIFLTIMCVLYIKSNLIGINPLISLLGYHIYQIEYRNVVEKGKQDTGMILLISKQNKYSLNKAKQPVSVNRISNELFILKGE